MHWNIGTWDRRIRVIAGVVLLALTWIGSIGAWGWIGLIPLATGLAGRCPMYALLGIDSRRLGRRLS